MQRYQARPTLPLEGLAQRNNAAASALRHWRIVAVGVAIGSFGIPLS
jgi:hypothetical protein